MVVGVVVVDVPPNGMDDQFSWSACCGILIAFKATSNHYSAAVRFNVIQQHTPKSPPPVGAPKAGLAAACAPKGLAAGCTDPNAGVVVAVVPKPVVAGFAPNKPPLAVDPKPVDG